MKQGMKQAFWIFCLAAFALALPALLWRTSLEKERRGALVVADGSRMYQLADWKTLPEALTRLKNAGVTMVMTGEYTGAELVEGAIAGLTLPEAFPRPEGLTGDNWTAVATAGPWADEMAAFLRLRFPGMFKGETGGTVYFYLPIPRRQALKAGILPDFPLMAAARSAAIPMIYRPMPYGYGESSQLLASLDWIVDQYPQVKVVAPGGDVVAAYPDSRALAAFVKEKGLLLAMPEFSTQVGAAAGWSAAWPNIVSMHAVTDDEVITRKINRPTMLRRLDRAAFERNVNLLVLRPDALRGDSQRLALLEADVAALKADLEARKIPVRLQGSWPNRPQWMSLFASLGLGLLGVVLLFRLIRRFRWMERRPSVLLVVLKTVICGLLIWKSGAVSRVTGGLVTGMLAAEAALLAMEHHRAPLRGLVESLILVYLGGLIIAGFYSTPLAMARLQPFSGVKLTLLLPLIIVFFHDLLGGEHPESLPSILGRSSRWAELVLLGVVMLAALVLVVRSDNTSFVPGFERLMRDGLENLLVARPRTKELWIGYPALVLWFACKRYELFPEYREALRLASTLAFSSAVNTFCHFHTPMKLTLLRDFNGWWSGILVGLVLLVLLRSVARRLRRYCVR